MPGYYDLTLESNADGAAGGGRIDRNRNGVRYNSRIYNVFPDEMGWNGYFGLVEESNRKIQQHKTGRAGFLDARRFWESCPPAEF